MFFDVLSFLSILVVKIAEFVQNRYTDNTFIYTKHKNNLCSV